MNIEFSKYQKAVLIFAGGWVIGEVLTLDYQSKLFIAISGLCIWCYVNGVFSFFKNRGL